MDSKRVHTTSNTSLKEEYSKFLWQKWWHLEGKCMLNSAIMLSWKKIPWISQYYMVVPEYREHIPLLQMWFWFLFFLEQSAKVQAGLFLLEGMLQLYLFTRNTEVFIPGYNILPNRCIAQKCFLSISQSQILSHPSISLFL